MRSPRSTWPRDRAPANPGAWPMVTARNLERRIAELHRVALDGRRQRADELHHRCTLAPDQAAARARRRARRHHRVWLGGCDPRDRRRDRGSPLRARHNSAQGRLRRTGDRPLTTYRGGGRPGPGARAGSGCEPRSLFAAGLLELRRRHPAGRGSGRRSCVCSVVPSLVSRAPSGWTHTATHQPIGGPIMRPRIEGPALSLSPA